MIKELTFQEALSHNSQIHINYVAPIDESDIRCVEEIRDVLVRNGKLTRFGVSLIHKHFDLKAGEILLESTDEEARCQTVRPMPRSANTGTEMRPTVFLLEALETGMICSASCVISNSTHSRKHVYYG